MEFICKVIFAWLEWEAQNRPADANSECLGSAVERFKGVLVQEAFYGADGEGGQYQQSDTWTR